MLSFSHPQIWLYERLRLFHPPTVLPNQYQPKHYRDHKLKSKEMDPNEFTEFLKCLSPSGIQWVVEWWRIIDMVNHVFKDNCVNWLGFAIAFTTPYVALQDNLVIAKVFPMMKASSIP